MDDDDFATALRAAIAASGLSLDEVRTRLMAHDVRVSIASLSYWQSGRSRPHRAASLAALGPLEEVLGIPRGHLVSRVRPPTPRASDWTDTHPGPLAEEAMRLLGAGEHPVVRRRSIHDRIELDAAGRHRVHRVRCVVTAVADRVAAVPVWTGRQGWHAGAHVRGVVNCRVGRAVPMPASGGLAAEMVLDHPLQVGESALFEYEVTTVGDRPWTGYTRLLDELVREYVVEVAYDPAAPPTAAEAISVVDGREHVTPVRVAAPLAVVVLEAPPGRHGLRWTW